MDFSLFQVTQTVARGPGGPRSQVALPAQGIIELRDALTELLEAFGQDEGGIYLSVHPFDN